MTYATYMTYRSAPGRRDRPGAIGPRYLTAAGVRRYLSTPASKTTAGMWPTDQDLIIARQALERVMHSSDSQGLAQR